MATKNTATELATFPITLSQEDATPLQKATYEENLPLVSGFIDGLWGYQVEDPTKLHWMLNWIDIEAHHAYIASPTYANLIKGVGTFSGPPSLHHANVARPAKVLGSAPVVEWATIHLAPGTDKDEWVKGLNKLEEIFEESAEGKNVGFYGVAGGWGVENQRAYTLLIGWESVEHHKKWKESCSPEMLERGMAMFREGVKSVDMVHVKVGGRVVGKAGKL